MNLLASLVAVSSVMLAVGIWWFARRRAEYSHVRHTISELGETGAPDSQAVSFGLFLPFGLYMVAVYALERTTHLQAAYLAACIGVGYLGAATFPCDPGSPLTGSWRQSLHNLAGGVQYVGGAVAIWAMASNRFLFEVLALLVGAAAVLLSVPAVNPWRGAIQRVAELALLGALVLALGAP